MLFKDFNFFNHDLFGLNFLGVTFVLGGFDLHLKSGKFFVGLFLIGFSSGDLSFDLVSVGVGGQQLLFEGFDTCSSSLDSLSGFIDLGLETIDEV